MTYSRQNPSQKYTELVTHYSSMHQEGLPDEGVAPENLYYGASLIRHLPIIRDLVAESGAKSMLDYGSGKGRFYELRDIELRTGEVIPSVAEYLGLSSIRCYDPAVKSHSTLPDEKFDIVISTDALEHCPEPDLPWIVDEIFGFATKMVYANVASYPAIKRLPNGENAHATQRDHLWWKDLLDDVSNRHPGVHYRFEIDQIERSLKTLFKRQKRAHRIVG
jgi:hypothetical protein